MRLFGYLKRNLCIYLCCFSWNYTVTSATACHRVAFGMEMTKSEQFIY